MAIAKELTFSNFQHFRSHCEGLKIAMAPPKGGAHLCRKDLSALSTIRLTLSNAVINGKQNDTATL